MSVTQYGLSPMQQGMLYQSQLRPGAGIDVVQVLITLWEELNLEAFQRAWAAVMRRHDVLRTRFRWKGLKEPLQQVRTESDLPFEIFDAQNSSPQQQQRRVQEYLVSDRVRGFNLSSAPLLRVIVFIFGPTHYKCVLTFHHIILDGHSLRIVLQEVFAHYEAFRRRQALTLALPRPYWHFIEWLQQTGPEASKPFWKNWLKSFSAPTPFRVDRSVSAEPSRHERFDTEVAALSPQITQLLKALAQQNNVTRSTLLLGAWSLLLSRYSGENDIVFGEARAGRRATIDGVDQMVGLFINTLAMRIGISSDQMLIPWLQEIRRRQIALRPYQHAPLMKIQQWSEVPRGSPLFESILVIENFRLNSYFRSMGEGWKDRLFDLLEPPGYPATLYAYLDEQIVLKLIYSCDRFTRATAERALGHLRVILEAMAANPNRRLSEIPILTEQEKKTILIDWNNTDTDYRRDVCVHSLIEQQADRTPEKTAVVFKGQQLTYLELDQRGNQLAQKLIQIGIQPGMLVGLLMRRSLELVVGLLGILKAGAAYLPLDPAYPKARLSQVFEDANLSVVLIQPELISQLPEYKGTLITLNPAWQSINSQSDARPDTAVSSDHLGYVLYTSGSTGTPKGVMVTHRNVVNFFAGMDERIDHDPPGVWLTATSISFDISVLELFWTLARGFEVILQPEEETAPTILATRKTGKRKIDFSLFYFAAHEPEARTDKYRLLIEGAEFADENGFCAVWTPERHFHSFGGIYPNPSVTGAAIAAITKRIGIRAGSVVLPLHNPVRVAEEWAVVDNLSAGRVGISFASGWHADDFVLAPLNYAKRKEIMSRQIETVQKLWRGESIELSGGAGNEISVRIYPRPVQADLPIWLTAAGSPETFRLAGQIGANVLTHFLGQSIDQLAAKIQIYRKAWAEKGRDPARAKVTLMLHCFIGEDLDEIRRLVREPLLRYLQSSSDLVQKFAQTMGQVAPAADLKKEQLQPLWERAFERYFRTSGLFGTRTSCLPLIERLHGIGVDEIACLIDYGVAFDQVMRSLPLLKELKDAHDKEAQAVAEDYSIPAQIRRHKVTHFQCTPSRARILLISQDGKQALRSLRQLLVGGEPMPASLLQELGNVPCRQILNMYGPTETTVWSTSEPIDPKAPVISIGRPIANTRVYIVDPQFQLLPIGVPGELVIGGDGVARGYLNQSELTDEKFVLDPFQANNRSRLYRTGDRARYLPDGRIEFLNRMDQQVKLRGYRVELGEIEAMLNASPQVRESIVLAREEQAGEPRLTAYIVAKGSAPPSTAELREFLQERLPPFMVPALFQFLDALPRTPNGKVDRQALLRQERTNHRTLAQAYAAPRNPTEKRLAEIWSSVLGVKKVSISDNFFELGGDSLLAVNLFLQIEGRFGKKLPLATLFRAPTLEQLSEVIVSGSDLKSAWSPLVPIQPLGRKPPFYCVHGGPGNVLLFRDLARHLGSEYPFCGLQSHGLQGTGRSFARLEDIAAQYLKEIRSVQPEGAYYLGGYCMGGLVAYEMAQQLRGEGQEVALLVLMDTYNPAALSERLTVQERALLLAQKWAFHWANMRELGAARGRHYFAKKLQGVKERQLEKLSIQLSNTAEQLKLFKRDKQFRFFLEDINSRVGAAYKPQVYPGKITLMRPCRNFRRYSDPQMAWGDMAEGGVAVIELPVNPGGIFVDPYVRQLARELAVCIDRAEREQACAKSVAQKETQKLIEVP